MDMDNFSMLISLIFTPMVGSQNVFTLTAAY